MEIVKYGNPVLRAKGARIETITEEIRQLAAAMIETMNEANGVGLAAQQVGHALQLAIVDVAGVEDRPSEMLVDGKEVKIDDWMPMVLLNPVLELGKEKEFGPEGCLSFPEISADIQRSIVVKATARLIDGREVTFEARGFLARALQHEVDHLNGILFIDRMNSATKVSLAGRLKRLQRAG
ncbi:MAG: peptide deformylase [Verrucomicrobia bacterium]|nr:peptide deformylase [Verrucomicrobiota bacterium]